uniref:RING-type domain-containing protein n=1 Tax=Glycine max TaxID=3847 RepID=C6T7M8_SOYBN|nr:unknown [Glycine max]
MNMSTSFFLVHHMLRRVHTPSNSSFYKFGISEPVNTSYYRYGHGYESAAVSTEWVEGGNTGTRDNSIECPRRHHSNSNDYQVIWQDNIDPDNMTYEELLELGEAVGTQSRGLTQEQISSLPVSKYKCGFFLRKKSRDERCVICQMEYKRGDERITLPCKHVYHASCGNKWLSINKACPICYTEVFADKSKHK